MIWFVNQRNFNDIFVMSEVVFKNKIKYFSDTKGFLSREMFSEVPEYITRFNNKKNAYQFAINIVDFNIEESTIKDEMIKSLRRNLDG